MAKEIIMKFFSVDGGIYKFLSRFWDMVKLNFLWLICSLPIVTVGVSTIAAYTVTLKMIDDKEGYVAKSFFKAFKDNFKQGMAVGIITLVCMYVLFLDFQLANSSVAIFVVGIISAYLFLMVLIYTYPLLARYDNRLLQTMKNSWLISTRFFGKTFMLLFVIAIEVVVFLFNSITLIVGVLIGPACIFYTVSGVAMHFFRQIEKEGGCKTRDEDNHLIDETTEDNDSIKEIGNENI